MQLSTGRGIIQAKIPWILCSSVASQACWFLRTPGLCYLHYKHHSRKTIYVHRNFQRTKLQSALGNSKPYEAANRIFSDPGLLREEFIMSAWIKAINFESVCKLKFTMIAIDSSTRQEVRGPTQSLHTLLNFLVDFPGADFAQVIKHVQYRSWNFFLSESLKSKGPSIFPL